MVNTVILVGRVGKDPEFRVTAGGTPMAKFSLVTTEKRKDKNGNYVESKEWHKCTIWGKMAEVLQKYVHKGSLLYLTARIHYDSYENKEGQKVYTTDIIVNTFQMLDGKPSSSSGQGHAPEPPRQDAPPAGGFGDDDLPF